MALSYAAYNPLLSQFLPLIPSSFMQTPYDNVENTAKAELLSKGFVATEFNYEEGSDIYAAHTIGHKEITINDYNAIVGGNNDANNDVAVGSVGDNSTSFPSIEAYSNADSFRISGNNGENILSSTDNGRQLVVVVVRGSVTFKDWVVDLGNQINNEQYNFKTGMKEIIKSLYGCTELCDECNGTGCENTSVGYLDGINNPVILITGHSLGAAVANLAANYLTQELGMDNVYAYTFATPNTVNKAKGEVPIKHDNIFNILNNNDAVPHFPMNLVVNEWERHGQDFHITMPLNVDWILGVDLALLGAAGHAMPNYYSWLNNLPGTLGKSAEDITVADLEEMSVDYAVGLGAKIFKVLCPVSVTLYDSDGNVVAYESQQEGAVYPEITDSGIVSWITDDGDKIFVIPYGTENIEARIEAYDYGTMTLTVEQPGIGEPLDTITYNNVNLYPDKEFKVEIAESFDSDEVALMQVETDENGNEIETEITDLNPYLIGASVDVDEVVHGQPCTMTFVTHKDAVKTQIQYNGTVATVTFSRDHPWIVSLVEDGDTLIWTIQPVLNRIGEHVFDVNVKMGSTWYSTEKVFALKIT